MNHPNNSEKLVKNIAEIIENVEIDDADVQQSIAEIKTLSNQSINHEINCINETEKNNSDE